MGYGQDHPVHALPGSTGPLPGPDRPTEAAGVRPALNEQYKQIGNAVPIKLGEAIAKTIIADMTGEELPTFSGFAFSRYKNTSEITWQNAMNATLGQHRITGL